VPFTAEIFKPTKTTKIKKYVATPAPAEPSLKSKQKSGRGNQDS